MHSAVLVIENLTDQGSQFGWLLAEIEKALKMHTEIKSLSKNVLLIPEHLVLIAISEIDALCRASSAQPGQNFGYKCLYLKEEPKWIYSTNR